MIDILGKKFSLSDTQHYTLSIRFLPDGFCFAILDEAGKVIRFSQYERSQSLSDIECLQRDFQTVLLCCDSDQYTLLPQNIFQEKDIPLYWKLNFGANTTEELHYNEIRLINVTNLFSVDKNVVSEVTRLFPTVQLTHRQSIHINHCVRRNKQDGGKQLFVYMNNKSFDVVLVENGSLLLANTYCYHNEDEFLYFVLNVFDQLKLDQYHIDTIIGGTTESDSKMEKLRKYVKNILLDDGEEETEQNFLHSQEFLLQRHWISLS